MVEIISNGYFVFIASQTLQKLHSNNIEVMENLLTHSLGQFKYYVIQGGGESFDFSDKV